MLAIGSRCVPFTNLEFTPYRGTSGRTRYKSTAQRHFECLQTTVIHSNVHTHNPHCTVLTENDPHTMMAGTICMITSVIFPAFSLIMAFVAREKRAENCCSIDDAKSVLSPFSASFGNSALSTTWSLVLSRCSLIAIYYKVFQKQISMWRAAHTLNGRGERC